jgi:hypothetical protein
MSAGPDPGVQPRRGSAVVGTVLIVLGGLFLAEQALGAQIGRYGWPLFVIIPGLAILGASLVSGGRDASGLAVAGGIVTTVGLILLVQNATGLWATWAYAWALVGPGGTGLGLLLFGLVRRRPDSVSSGLRSLGAGLGLFAVFGLFFEGVIGLSGEPFLLGSDILPVALIVLGGVFLGLGVFRGRSGGTARG